VAYYHERLGNYEQNGSPAKEAKSFIRRITQEKEERERQKQEKARLMHEKLLREQEEAERRREEDKAMFEEQYRLKKAELKEKLKEKEEQRRRFRDDTAVAVKQVMRERPLYMVIEDKYRESIEMPDLEEKKKRLQDLRNFYKPITDMKIDKHQKDYDMVKRQMDSEIRRQREMSQKQIREHIARLKYRPHLTDYKDEARQQAIEQLEKQREDKRKAIDKVGNYAKYVKEMYWPKVSQKKREELSLNRDGLNGLKPKRSNSHRRLLNPSQTEEEFSQEMQEDYYEDRSLPQVHSMP